MSFLVPTQGTATAADTAALVAEVADPRGDVRLFDREGDEPSRAEKKSIDLRRAVITRGDYGVRVTVTFRDVIRSDRFDQMFFVIWSEKDGAPGEPWSGNAGFTTHKDSYAYLTTKDSGADEFVSCAGTEVVVRPALNRATVTVPKRCTPDDKSRIRVLSATGFFESDAPVYSEDRLRFLGAYDVS